MNICVNGIVFVLKKVLHLLVNNNKNVKHRNNNPNAAITRRQVKSGDADSCRNCKAKQTKTIKNLPSIQGETYRRG